MSKKEELVTALDDAAFRLLRKVGKDGTVSAQDSAILVEEVKAFGEVVKYAEIRVGLIPKDNKADAKFVGIKETFHGINRTPRGRRAASPPPAESGPTSAAINLLLAADAGDNGDEAE